MSHKILLSGVKPTGRPHIANYFGAMKQFVDLQNNYQTYVMIADLHALTTVQDAKQLKADTLDLIIDYLAIGLDPEKVVLFKQSDVSEHAELAWIFDCITTVPYLMRAHAFKDAEAKSKEVNAGLFTYPMLMAADILLYNADVVPVGKDQKQHIEYARDTAEKFNRLFGETFKLPEPLILESVETVPGLDGQKMSKSYGNTIPLFAEDDEIKKLVMSIKTDSKEVFEPKDPESHIFKIYELFENPKTAKTMRDQFSKGGVGYKEFKEILINLIIAFITPLREKRKEIAKNPEKVIEILKKGGEVAKQSAKMKMSEVRARVGIDL